jgi:hypothetical protein
MTPKKLQPHPNLFLIAGALQEACPAITSSGWGNKNAGKET